MTILSKKNTVQISKNKTTSVHKITIARSGITVEIDANSKAIKSVKNQSEALTEVVGLGIKGKLFRSNKTALQVQWVGKDLLLRNFSVRNRSQVRIKNVAGAEDLYTKPPKKNRPNSNTKKPSFEKTGHAITFPKSNEK